MNRLILVLIIGLFACNSTNDKQNNTFEKPLIDSVSMIEQQNVLTNCARGVAEPILKKTVFPQSTFVLQSDSFTGIETLTFDNGDNLTIRNWGCEYYVLTFRFETSRFQQDTTNLDFWVKSVASLTRELLHGLDAPIDISNGIDKLIAHLDNNGTFKLREEIDFGADDIRSCVSVDRVEKVTDKKYAVEITFATGPL